MQDEHRKFLWTQQVVSAVLNAIISALFVWLVFRATEHIGLWGGSGLAFDLLPTTFMITLMMSIGLTLVTRGAVRRGQVPRIDGASSLPRNVLLRALTLAVGATLLLVPLSIALLWLVWGRDWTYNEVLIFKVAYGILLGAVLTPIIIGAALRDRPLGASRA